MQKNMKTEKKTLQPIDLSVEPDNSTFIGKVRRLRNEYGYLWMAFAIPAIIIFLIYLARGIHPFGDSSVLVLDLGGQYVNFYTAVRNTVYEGTSLIYSWSRQLGGEFLGIYAYYVASPLTYIVCLFPKDRICEALLVIFMIKGGICGTTMGYYLHKTEKMHNKLTVIAFSVLYSVGTSYCIVQMHNSMWIDAVMWLPLVTLGIENIIKNGKYKMFVIFLALTIFSNFYIGYMVAIYVALYYFYYLAANKDNGENNPFKERNHGTRSFVRIAVYSAIAVGMATCIILSAYYSLQFGKNTFSTPNWKPEARISMLDFLTKFFPCSYDTVRPDGLPFVYCGVLTLLLVPAFFVSKKFTSRQKIVSGIFILVFVASFLISTFDLIWHGFQKPNWLNNRYSFMLCFFLITLAYRVFNVIETVNLKVLLTSSVIICLFIVFADRMPDTDNVRDFGTVLLTLAAVAVYFSLICLLPKILNKEIISTILLFVVCIEAYLSGLSELNSLGKDVGFTSYSNFNNSINELTPSVERIQDYDDSFYRMEKTYWRKTNEQMTHNMRGLANSSSTLNKDVIYILRMFGYASYSNLSRYIGGNPVNDSLTGIKYLISDKDLSMYYENIEQKIADKAGTELSDDKYKVYYNPYNLGIAFGADDKITDLNAVFENNTGIYNMHPVGYALAFDRLNALYSSILGENVKIFVPLKQTKEIQLENCELSDYKPSSGDVHMKFQKIDPEEDATAKFTYDVSGIPKGTEFFTYQPTELLRFLKWNSSFGKSGEFDKNDSNSIISIGTKSSDKDEMTFTITHKQSLGKNKTNASNEDNFYLAENDANSYVYYIDWAEFTRAATAIQNTAIFTPDDKYTETDIPGSMTTIKDSQYIMTTIPYDKCWNIYVDGKPVEYEKLLTGLIGFRIDKAGEHSVEFKYVSTPFVTGLAISGISTAVFIAFIVTEKYWVKIPVIDKFLNPDYDERKRKKKEEMKKAKAEKKKPINAK